MCTMNNFLCAFAWHSLVSRTRFHVLPFQVRGGEMIWETAGRGFVHDGFWMKDETRNHGMLAQIWVNLPGKVDRCA